MGVGVQIESALPVLTKKTLRLFTLNLVLACQTTTPRTDRREQTDQEGKVSVYLYDYLSQFMLENVLN